MAKAVIIRENDIFRFMDTDNKDIDAKSLNLRSRITNGDLKYYEMDLSEEKLKGLHPHSFIEVLNRYPHLADKTEILIEI